MLKVFEPRAERLPPLISHINIRNALRLALYNRLKLCNLPIPSLHPLVQTQY